MPDVVMDMEQGKMEVVGLPMTSGPGMKVRKFPDVAPELLAQAREMELEKQELARQKEKRGNNYDPVLRAQTKELCMELSNLWIEIRKIQLVATVANRARERLKQTEAAEKAARRAGHAT